LQIDDRETGFITRDHYCSYSVARQDRAQIEIEPIVEMEVPVPGMKRKCAGIPIMVTAVGAINPLIHARSRRGADQFQWTGANVGCRCRNPQQGMTGDLSPVQIPAVKVIARYIRP